MADNDIITSSSSSTSSTPRWSDFERTFDEMKIPKHEMNEIVMDYLMTNGYPAAADKFAAEASVQPQGDLDTITQRIEIRKDILSGQIHNAIYKIHDLEPLVLDDNTDLLFTLLQAQLLEFIRAYLTNPHPNADINAPLDFATERLAPIAPTNPDFLARLEDTMCLLIFPPDGYSEALKALLDPARRIDIAAGVNEAILRSKGGTGKSKLSGLLKTRVWAERQAKEKQLNIPERLDVALADPAHVTVPNALDDGIPMDIEI